MRWSVGKFDSARAAGLAAAATGAAIPVSTAATGVLTTLAVLLGVFSGIYARHWRTILAHPIVPPALALFMWLALSLTYTQAPLDEGLRLLKKYRELLLIPLLLPLFIDPRVRRLGLHAFLAAMLVTLLASYADALWQILDRGGIKDDPEVFKKHIAQGTLLVFAGYWVAQRLLKDPAHWGVWALLLSLITVNLFVMVGGRTGQGLFLALAVLLLYQRFRWKGLAIAAVSSAVLLVSVYLTSAAFLIRLDESLNGLGDYQAGDFSTSTTLRMSYYPNSLALIAERPLLGHGLGSFTEVYAGQVAGTAFPPTSNPHNEFLLLGVQAGLIGSGLFLALLLLQLRQARRLPIIERPLAQALVVVMVVGCLLNSFLYDTTEGHLYAYFSALLFAPLLTPELGLE